MRTIASIATYIADFSEGWKTASDRMLCRCYIEEAKKQRENLSEKQLDKMLADTFPASDPVAMY